MRELDPHLPVFGPEAARCFECELQHQCKSGRVVTSQRPKGPFNGLMILGEGPGKHEVIQKRPFVGPSGHLLDALLQSAAIDRDQCYIANTTLCLPYATEGAGKEKGFHKRFPNAIPSCLPRLEEELKAVRPRVVACLGVPAALAAHGHFVTRTKQIDIACDRCSKVDRKIGPALACAGGECDWYVSWEGMTNVEAEPRRQELLVELNKRCPKCDARIDRLKIRRIKCPECGGRKKKIVEYEAFESQFSMGEALGGLFLAEELPSRWDEFGVKYVITTFHPSFCLREPSKESKVFGGQHAARAVVDHLEKARKLLERDAMFDLEVHITDRAGDVIEYLERHGPGSYCVDIETNAQSPWDVDDLRCIGIGRADTPLVLVVDTRRAFSVSSSRESEEHPIVFDIKPRDLEMITVLREFFVHPAFGKYGQNFQYDALVLRRFFGVPIAPIIGDLKLAHHNYVPDEPHDLAHISACLTEAEHWKPPKKIGNALQYKDFVELAVYCARDVRTNALAHEALAGHPL